MINRTFKTYRALFQALQRDGIAPAGPIATLLLETFVYHKGRLSAGLVVERRLCADKKFKKWRQPLIDKGWLVFDQQKNKDDWTLHTEGSKLINYINKEKSLREPMATRAEVEQLKKEFDDKISALVEKVMEKLDPPYTSERAALWLEGEIKTVAELDGEGLE